MGAAGLLVGYMQSWFQRHCCSASHRLLKREHLDLKITPYQVGRQTGPARLAALIAWNGDRLL